ncbi:bifunctional 4-hydroxy-2-oxoglutarate aldolase/2-dehydro-3-deoxy-phosphogluconate aldolase [Atopobiaceae bacterium 24-176]
MYKDNPAITATLDRLGEIGIVPVVTVDNPDFAVPLARALVAGGLPAAEVTFRTPCAAECIRRMAQEVPELLVGAGTVLDVPTTEAAVEAGAQFIVSPGLAEDSVRWCVRHEVPVVPGLATPSEVVRAIDLGVDHVKLFPASVVGGTAMLHAMAGPFGNVKFMCTGGIKPANAQEYLDASNVFCVGGTWVAPADVVAAGDFATVERLVREAAALV